MTDNELRTDAFRQRWRSVPAMTTPQPDTLRAALDAHESYPVLRPTDAIDEPVTGCKCGWREASNDPRAGWLQWADHREAAVRAAIEAEASASAGALREALQQIIDLPTIVPDHAHGGVHPPYLEWSRVAAVARAALAAQPAADAEP